MIRRVLILVFALALPAGEALAQLTVQILRGMAESVPIAVVPLAWDGAGPVPWDVAATVQADLERSGASGRCHAASSSSSRTPRRTLTLPTGGC